MAVETLLISVGVPQFIGIIFTVTFSLMAVAWKVGGRLSRVETLVESIRHELDDWKDSVDQTIEDLELDFDNFKSGSFENGSPIQLTAKGERILTESGFKNYIDSHRDTLLNYCQTNFKMDTAYDIQEVIFEYFRKLELEPDFEKKLKEYVFNEGISMELARRIGAIYFRDICLKHFNKDAHELDG